MKRKIINIINSFYISFLKKKKNINNNIIHLGTFYGGYDIVDLKNIKIIISCGLGEDASFDIEIINKYYAKNIILDPTPRSIIHFNSIKKNFGKRRIFSYRAKGGKLHARSYNLKKINSNNMIFLNKAISDKNNDKMKLYYPNNKKMVSASIYKDKNYSNNFFLANTIDLNSLIKKYKIKKIDILKLDIEGGEINILNNLLKKKIFPKQILVEFKDIKTINPIKFIKIYCINKKLSDNGYSFIFKNKKGDITYLKNA